jgi:ribosomal protein L7/L12
MYCRRCGTHNPDTASICQSCKALLPKPEPKRTTAPQDDRRTTGPVDDRHTTAPPDPRRTTAPLDPGRGTGQLGLGQRRSVGGDNPNEPQVVWLHAAGKQKVKIIKVIAQLTGMSDPEAFAMIQGAPCVLKTVSGVQEAEKYKKALEAHGAIVKTEARRTRDQRVISRSVAADAARAAGTAKPTHKIENQAELKGHYRVTLRSAGRGKIGVTNRVVQFTRVSLKAASALVDSAPCTIISGVSPARAYEIGDALEKLGAEVLVEKEPG